MKNLRKWQLACRVLTIAALATFSDVVSATTCIPNRSTLTERYAIANAIVIAQANLCKGLAMADGSTCPENEYQFSILEVLKDADPSRDHSGTFRGSDNMGCGLEFQLGHSYLLYLNDEGKPLLRFGGRFDNERPRSRLVKESVRILREYRDNIVKDLSGPWSFSDSGLSCGIGHRFRGALISLSFHYQEDEFRNETLTSVEGNGPRGEALWQVKNDSNSHSRDKTDTTVEYNGPKLERGGISLRVVVENRKNATDGFVTMSVGARNWRLSPMTVTMSGSFATQSVYIIDILGGDDALAIYRALSGPAKQITITTNQPKDSVELDYPTLLQTRNTQFARSIESFDKCVSGEKRRGAIITNQ